MKYQIQDFSEIYVDVATDLFFQSLDREREANPILPVEMIRDSNIIPTSLRSLADNAGVVIVENNRLVGYMLTGARFRFKGQNTAIVNEYCHGSIEENKSDIYRLMYMNLANEWIKNDIHLHILGYLSNDNDLKQVLFHFGFGAILAERIRNLVSIKETVDYKVGYEADPSKLLDIQIEHNKYYKNGPIFIKKDENPDTILSELKEHGSNGDQFIVYPADAKPMAYFIVGESNKDAEGFLLQRTNTAQIKSAFVSASLRGGGIGSSLLQESITWAKRNGFERMFVEHETANYYGGNFWGKHFSSYLNFSMRYIDNSL